MVQSKLVKSSDLDSTQPKTRIRIEPDSVKGPFAESESNRDSPKPSSANRDSANQTGHGALAVPKAVQKLRQKDGHEVKTGDS